MNHIHEVEKYHSPEAVLTTAACQPAAEVVQGVSKAGPVMMREGKSMPWSIVFVAMSGIALGKSVLSSGLSNDMDTLIERVLKGLSLWPITIIFGFLVLITSTSISHTVASVLSIPIAFKIGNREFYACLVEVQ
ncbi:hypothetical protein PSHT_13534 [Puccinia striiformis]|uniref:Phosphate transporter n=1 Tax=Puccinia striiformis TaxID=27350 RepID=A0A2S4UQT1_9BASI|nr:hypothetical protein PSHT_13534 [Puccinia striiformis]